jgi:uncharacterized protein (DUF2141 family)
MSKFALSLLIGSAFLAAPAAEAAMLGQHAADCARGAGKPAMLVKVDGFKTRKGLVRVQLYGGNPENYFDKGTYLQRVEVPVTPAGPVEVCLSPPNPGVYAVSVRHDANGNGSTDIGEDGGGFSGNPNLSLFDVMFKRHPSPVQVQVKVTGLTTVPVILNYLRGGSVGPIGGR